MSDPAVHHLFELYESRISKESILERSSDGSVELSRRNAHGETTTYDLRVGGVPRGPVLAQHIADALLKGPPLIPTILSLLGSKTGAGEAKIGGDLNLAATAGILQVMPTDVGTITLFLPDDPSSGSSLGNLQIVLLTGEAKAQENFVTTAETLAKGLAKGMSPLRAALESCPAAVEMIGRPDPSMHAAMTHLDLSAVVPQAQEPAALPNAANAQDTEPDMQKKSPRL